MSLEDLERDIYSRNSRGRIKKRGQDKKDENFSDSASFDFGRFKKRIKDRIIESREENDDSLRAKLRRMGKWILMSMAGLAVVTLMISGFYLFRIWMSDGIRVIIQTPEEPVLIGDPFKVTVAIENMSGREVKDGRALLSIPEGILFVGESEDKRFLSIPIDDVSNQRISRVDFELLAINGTESVRELSVSFFYENNLGIEFERDAKQDLVLGEPVIFVDIISPEKVLSGESFDLELMVRNLAERDVEGVAVYLERPGNLNIVSVNKEEFDVDLSKWKVGNMDAGEERQLKLGAEMLGSAQSFFDIITSVGVLAAGEERLLGEVIKSLSIQVSPLALDIFMNNSQSLTAGSGDRVRYTLVYKNNTDQEIRDLILTVKMDGEMFDFSNVSSAGVFDLREQAITWTAARDSGLLRLAPGAGGTIDFSLGIRKDYPINSAEDKNFTVNAVAEIDTLSVPEGMGGRRIFGIASLETKIEGTAGFETSVLFRDPAAGVVNAGPWPPKVGEATQFTVHWAVSALGTDITDVNVLTWLGPGVKFVRSIRDSGGELTYNERTQELTWKSSRVNSGAGVVLDPHLAIFQIELEPTAAMAGRTVELLGVTRLRARDDFTGKIINAEEAAINTGKLTDPTVTSAEGRVSN